MPSSNPTPTFVDKFSVPFVTDFGTYTHVELRRLKGGERLKFSQKKFKSELEGIREKICQQVLRLGCVDEATNTWRDELSSLPQALLDEADTLIEDYLIEAVVAVDNGYGSMGEWRDSEDFRKLESRS